MVNEGMIDMEPAD